MLKTTVSDLHELVSSSTEAMVTVDSKGKIIHFNTAFEELFCYEAGELTGAELDILLPERFRKKHVKYREHFFSEAVIRPMSTGLDLYGCKKDGTEFPVEITLHPFETEDGTLVYAAIRDLSEHKRTEAALRESQIRLKTIIDNMPAAIFLRDSDGCFVFVNHTYEEMYGVRNAEIRGKTLHDVFPKEEACEYSEHDARVVKDLSVIKEEATARSVKGDIVLSSSKFPILDDSGAYTGIAGIEYDITEHKRAIAELEKVESELREQSNFFQMLGRTAEHANTAATFEEGIQSFLTDICAFTGWPVGHAYIRASEGGDRLVPTGIWHMDGAEKFANFRKITEKTEFEPGVGLPGRVMASGKPAWITDVTKDANFPRAKLAIEIGVRAGFAIPVLVGSEVVAVLEFFATEAREPDDSLLMTFMQTGSQLGRVAERSHAEKTLLDSEKRLQSILDASPIGWTIHRATDGTILETNEQLCDFLGMSRADVLKTPATELYSDPADRLSLFEQVKKDGFVRDREVAFKKADGTKVWALLSLKMAQYKGEPTIFSWVYDITERKRAEEERLRQSQKMDVLGQLTGKVAHDFNNLLTVLDCNIGLLKSQNIGHEQRQSLIKDCLAAVELGSNLTSRLTNFARKEPLADTSVDLNKLIVGFSDLLKRSLGEDISFEFVLSDDTLPVLVDIVLVEVALLNLAINARDAMPEGGMITVSLSKTIIDGKVESIYGNVEQRPYALLQVSDTGIGMAPEIKKRVFEAFFTTKDEGKGTGLGLSTVRDLAQSSSGFVQIESKLKKGTAVKIFLPLYEEEVS